jgi:hypothetical protein
MLDELFRELKDKWETLHTTTKGWMSHIETGYNSSEALDSEAEAVRESIMKKNFVLDNTARQLGDTSPDTTTALLEHAIRVRTYLEWTDSSYQELAQHSQGDLNAQELANSVVRARGAVSEQIEKIRETIRVQIAVPVEAPAETMIGASQPVSTTVESQSSNITAANQPASTTADGQGHVPVALKNPPTMVAASPSGGCGDLTKLSAEDKDNVFWLLPLVPQMIDPKTITVTLKLLKGPLNQADDLKCLNALTVDTLEHDWDTGVTNLEDFIDDTSSLTGDLRVISVLQFVHDQLKTLNNNLLFTVTQNERIEV